MSTHSCGSSAPVPAAVAQIVLSELTETSEHHTAHSPAANPARSTSGSQHLRWQLGPSLGQGAFAEVFQGIDTETGKFLAVKQIKLKKEGCAAAKALRREIDMMIHMPSHRNVVKYLGTEQTKDRLFIFLEYISGGSIAAMLEKFGALAESIVSRYTHELLCGLDFLHTSSIVHCDIKGANLLVSEDGIVKLADFNSSKFLVDIPLSGAQHDLRSIAGTPQFMAPEVAQQAGQGVKSDIWSVGCTVIQMLTASPPWNDSTNAMALIFRIGSAKGPPDFPPSISAACADFLSLCFKLKPQDRPSCQQLLLHEFGGVGGAGEGRGAEKGSVGGRPAAAHGCAARNSVDLGGRSGGFPMTFSGRSSGAGLALEGQSASDAPGTHPPGADGERGIALGFEDDCDLALMCEGNVCSVLRGVGFAKIWAGGRCNVGLSGAFGQFAFEVHVLRELTVTMQEAGAALPDTVHICRVGWSTRRSPTHALGENAWGWGYGGTARKVHDGVFEAYGERYGAGDVITCGVDLATGEVCFAKNGRSLGVAYRLDRPHIDVGIVPHILLKNMEVRVDWSSRNCSSCLPGYLPLQRAVALGACTHPVALATRPEVVMLVGLPACGKTTWARQHAEKNPDARYMVLSTDHILEQMKVSGLTRSNYNARWEQLMPEASEVLNKFIEVASKRRRNYLWDQTNVYASARRRKLAPFRGFLKRAVVMVLTSPILEQRTRAREASEGKIVPEEAVQQMRSNFMPPSTSEGFDEVEFVGELTADEAVAHIAADRKTAALWLAAHKKRKADDEEEEMRKRALLQAQVQHVLLPGTAWRPGAEEDSMRSLSNTIHAPPPHQTQGGGMGGGGGGGAWGGMEIVGGREEGPGHWQGGDGGGGNGWYWPQQQPPPNPHDAHAPAFYPGPHHQLPPWVAAAAAPPHPNYPPPQNPL